MSELTTIQIRKSTSRSLKETMRYRRETYDEVIVRLVELFNSVERKNQYDEFLHKVQQRKMRELWDNEDDQEWDHV
ncbi:MAG: hypothetical protein KAH57_04505 [Thermoplasmata archaeon]|nr:hypothetical protein [Thermoplasmata archaeon]